MGFVESLEMGLVLSIKRLLNKEWHVKLQHISRGVNKVADKMAAKGRAQRGSSARFMVPPEDVRDLLELEKVHSEPVHDDLTREGALPYDPGGGNIVW
ncbi:hypothetical protein V6N11_025950 [Hibiscus sabdariffa]|uniref:RNase H type-1 domain-containing protein n=1 Tax=Hibiscus sabdariffa TaxID=183260 RepID=A0ABR2SU81_9ROSI